MMLIHGIGNVISAFLLFLFMFAKMGLGPLTAALVVSTLLLLLDIMTLLYVKEALLINGLQSFMPHALLQEATDVDDVVVEEVSNHTSSETTTTPTIDGAKVKAFFKSKLGITITGIVLACIVLFAGFTVWNTYFNKISVDVFAGMSLKYEGNDGKGFATVQPGTIDYDKSDQELSTFMHSIDYTIENNGKLSNGKDVEVRAVYPKEEAKRLKVDVKSDTKQFKVSGLIVQYTSVSKMDKNLYEKAKSAVEKKMKKRSDDNDTYTFVDAYLAVRKDAGKNSYARSKLVFVYREDYKDFFDNDTEVNYSYVDIPFDSSFEAKDVYAYPSTLYNSDVRRVTDVKDVKAALADEFDDYTLQAIPY